MLCLYHIYATYVGSALDTKKEGRVEWSRVDEVEYQVGRVHMT